jgi:hypothetical protein
MIDMGLCDEDEGYQFDYVVRILDFEGQEA